MKTRIAINVLALLFVFIGLRAYFRLAHSAADAGVVVSEHRPVQWAMAFALLISALGVLLLAASLVDFMTSRKRRH